MNSCWCIRLLQYVVLITFIISCKSADPKKIYLILDPSLILQNPSPDWNQKLALELENQLKTMGEIPASYEVISKDPREFQQISISNLKNTVMVRLWGGFNEALSYHDLNQLCQNKNILGKVINYSYILRPMSQALINHRTQLSKAQVTGLDLWLGGFLRTAHFQTSPCESRARERLAGGSLYGELQDALAKDMRGMTLSTLLNIDSISRNEINYERKLREKIVQGVVPFLLPRL
jgi:hypothetical protein